MNKSSSGLLSSLISNNSSNCRSSSHFFRGSTSNFSLAQSETLQRSASISTATKENKAKTKEALSSSKQISNMMPLIKIAHLVNVKIKKHLYFVFCRLDQIRKMHQPEISSTYTLSNSLQIKKDQFKTNSIQKLIDFCSAYEGKYFSQNSFALQFNAFQNFKKMFNTSIFVGKLQKLQRVQAKAMKILSFIEIKNKQKQKIRNCIFEDTLLNIYEIKMKNAFKNVKISDKIQKIIKKSQQNEQEYLADEKPHESEETTLQLQSSHHLIIQENNISFEMISLNNQLQNYTNEIEETEMNDPSNKQIGSIEANPMNNVNDCKNKELGGQLSSLKDEVYFKMSISNPMVVGCKSKSIKAQYFLSKDDMLESSGFNMVDPKMKKINHLYNDSISSTTADLRTLFDNMLDDNLQVFHQLHLNQPEEVSSQSDIRCITEISTPTLKIQHCVSETNFISILSSQLPTKKINKKYQHHALHPIIQKKLNLCSNKHHKENRPKLEIQKTSSKVNNHPQNHQIQKNHQKTVYLSPASKVQPSFFNLQKIEDSFRLAEYSLNTKKSEKKNIEVKIPKDFFAESNEKKEVNFLTVQDPNKLTTPLKYISSSVQNLKNFRSSSEKQNNLQGITQTMGNQRLKLDNQNSIKCSAFDSENKRNSQSTRTKAKIDKSQMNTAKKMKIEIENLISRRSKNPTSIFKSVQL